MEQKQSQFKCSGDCLNCRAINDRRLQWQYCAAQFTYNTMRMIQSMQETINAMAGKIEEMDAKIAAIQDSEAMVFDPNAEVVIEAENGVKSEFPNLPIAQEGSGAAE